MDPHEERDHCNERERMKMRIALLEASVKSCELDCRSSKETIHRLLSEQDQERRKTANSAAALDSLKVEYDALLSGKRSTESEKQTLLEQLEAGKKVISAAQKESQCLEKQVQELERRLHISVSETEAAQGRLCMFLNKVIKVLQRVSTNTLLSTENNMGLNTEEVCNKTVSEMETRLAQMSAELSEQTALHHSTLQRAELAENQAQDLRERLHRLESELLTMDVLRDGLRQDKQQYEEFLEKLSEILKVETIALDVGFDMRLKLILSRAEQLMRQEGSALIESKSLTFSLQRKLKSQKDQLESRSLHIQLLRKKVLELEEERRSRSALAIHREDAQAENKRLQKKVERLQSELRATRLSTTELKAQLSHTDELKLKVMEQNQTVQEQKKKLDQLEERKVKVEKKLTSVTSDLEVKDRRSKEDQQELSTLRQSLKLLSEKERELADFRTDVSQIVGLDTSVGDVSNHEVLQLLDSALNHHHHHHHLHPCDGRLWLCPAHQQRVPQNQHYPESSVDMSTARSHSLNDSGIAFK
ncbi:coiled-coil domain-containing protein 170 [Periophthalmus magnuspinnatus]|uniref:coiled-coil domain-containing protein 170 n=1 Tax=Periophthalmus magnuspinnatus TaxID=409849 RepID=UPI00145B88ED|nr:coiled-coil domain-containing protein 170 [Periophthalmus magnuspinnatus]